MCGSLRDASRTRIALSEALAAAQAAGGRTELVDLREYELPALNGVEGVPDPERLRAKIESADGVLLATPNCRSRWMEQRRPAAHRESGPERYHLTRRASPRRMTVLTVDLSASTESASSASVHCLGTAK